MIFGVKLSRFSKVMSLAKNVLTHFDKYSVLSCGSEGTLNVLFRSRRILVGIRCITGPLQSRSFQHHFVPRYPKVKPKKYKYPLFYNPFGPRSPPSDKIVQLAERIAALTPEERALIGPALRDKIRTAFDMKLEKFDAAAKIKVIKEVRAFTNLGLKEAKDLIEKAPVVLKQGVTKEEANNIMEKTKAVGGVAVMEWKQDLR